MTYLILTAYATVWKLGDCLVVSSIILAALWLTLNR